MSTQTSTRLHVATRSDATTSSPRRLVANLGWNAQQIVAEIERLTSTDLDGEDVYLDAHTMRSLAEARAAINALLP